MNKYTLWGILSFCILVWISCGQAEDQAESIIQKAIAAHGGDGYDTLELQFRFRDRNYEIEKKGGAYKYTRIFSDSSGRTIVDVLNNEGFERAIDSEVQSLSVKEEMAYSNALNSVVYFALIPHGLNDAAVIKKYMGVSEIKGKTYYEIEVRFMEEGGGTDFEDVFLYWVDAETYFVDYLAYSFHVDGGGVRFRESTNRRKAGRVYLQDYINYKPEKQDVPLEDLMELYLSNQLEKLSEIKLIE